MFFDSTFFLGSRSQPSLTDRYEICSQVWCGVKPETFFQQEAFEKCWAHSPLRAAARPFTRCRFCRHCRTPPAHRCPHDNADANDDDDNDNNDNDNA